MLLLLIPKTYIYNLIKIWSVTAEIHFMSKSWTICEQDMNIEQLPWTSVSITGKKNLSTFLAGGWVGVLYEIKA